MTEIKYAGENTVNTLIEKIKTTIDRIDEVDVHLANVSNPHEVTADQVGAVSYSTQSLTDEQKAQAKDNIGVNDLPSGASAYQQLVTNTDGNVTWDDRLAWDEIISEEEVVPLTSIDFAIAEDYSSDGYYFLEDCGFTFTPTVGKLYKVIYDDKEYITEAINDELCVALGNISLWGYGSNTNEPFNFYFPGADAPVQITISISEGNGAHTFAVYAIEGTSVQIPSRYNALHGVIQRGAVGTSVVMNDVVGNTACGDYSHAEGDSTTASGHASHAEGLSTTASGDASHAEGDSTTASGHASHAEGTWNVASGHSSHAEGYNTRALGEYSHAEGFATRAMSNHQHVHGYNNRIDETNTYITIVGNGVDENGEVTYMSDSNTHRSNAHTLDRNGNAWFAGSVYLGGTGQDDATAEEVALKSDIPDAILTPATAAVGQTIVVKAVDDVGKPTEWETIDRFNTGIVTSGDGTAYTVTIDGITALEAGLSFTMIPHTTSTIAVPTLNVNGLGAKALRRPITANNATILSSVTDNWIYINKPVEVTYNGTYWVTTSLPRPYAEDIYGTVPIARGGTGATTLADIQKSFLTNGKMYTDSTINILTLPHGIYHFECDLSTEYGWPYDVSAGRANLIIFGHRNSDDTGFWSMVYIDLSSDVICINNHFWSSWNGWKKIAVASAINAEEVSF